MGWELLKEMARELDESEGDRASPGAAPATGLHATRLLRKRMREDDSLSIVPYPPRTIGSVRDNLHLHQNPEIKRTGKDGKPMTSKSITDDIRIERNAAKRLVVVNGRVVHGLFSSQVDRRWKDIMKAKSKAKEISNSSTFSPSPPGDTERTPGFLVHDLMVPPSKAAARFVASNLQQTESITVPSITLTVAGSSPTGRPAEPEASPTPLGPLTALAANGSAAAPESVRGAVGTMAPATTAAVTLAKETARTPPPKPFALYAPHSGPPIEGTDVDRNWHMETQELQRFLSAVKRCIHRRSSTVVAASPSAQSRSVAAGGAASGSVPIEATKVEKPLDRQAQQFLDVLEKDVAAVSKAAFLAEQNVKTYLEEHCRPSPRRSSHLERAPSQSDEKESLQAAVQVVLSQELLCEERLSQDQRSAESNTKEGGAGDTTKSPDEYQELLVSTAREAAIFRETARIIRRKARELCERRITPAP